MNDYPNLRQLAGDCGGKDCAKVYVSDRDTFVCQGDIVPDGVPGVRLGTGEAAVELPIMLIREALRAFDE